MIIMCRELANCLTALSQTVVEEFITEKYGSSEAVQVRLKQFLAVFIARYLSIQSHVAKADTHDACLQEMRGLVLDSNFTIGLKMTLLALNPICDAIFTIEADK